MIAAMIVGGPRDGELIALPDAGPVHFAVRRKPELAEVDTLTGPPFDTYSIVPERRSDGRWVLVWPRGVSG